MRAVVARRPVFRRIWRLGLPSVLLLAWTAAGPGAPPLPEISWKQALPGYVYQFPRDHFEHQEFRTEWWYYTGNVVDARGQRFGFELVFFRQGVARGAESRSAWAVRDLYLAHAALTDAAGRKFSYQERVNRAGPGLAGASRIGKRVWNGNWSLQWGPKDSQVMDAVADEFRFHLELEPETGPVIHGENGVSQKAEGAGMASHYVSFPRLKVRGEINSGTVTGQAWMDHEWFSNRLGEGQTGWDWFSVQLDNHTELMLGQLRRSDGTVDPHSSGTFIDAAGRARHLRNTEFTLTPGARFGKYPVEWRVRVPSLGVDLNCRPVLKDQQLKPAAGGPGYWEGAVDYSGTHKGAGYLEMTGYDGGVPLR